MSPGQLADRALTQVYRAGGLLGVMVEKRSLSRAGLDDVIIRLESAVKDLKGIAK